MQIIGSDISVNAIDTATKNMEFANIQLFANEGILDVREHRIINSPLIYSQHWPTEFNQKLLEGESK